MQDVKNKNSSILIGIFLFVSLSFFNICFLFLGVNVKVLLFL